MGDRTKYATELIFDNEPEGSASFTKTYVDECCFCTQRKDCVDVDEVVNSKYFTDYNLVKINSGSVCVSCAYCMSNKPLKNGHWLVTEDEYISISTSDLQDIFEDLVADEFSTPFALHLSKNPILSEHAYLYTPVCHDNIELVFDYDESTIRTTYDELFKIIDGIEVLRWHRFRIDDIRSSEPPVSSVDRVGVQTYKQIDDFLSQYNQNPIFDVAITLSNSRSDQNREEENINSILEKYDWK